jgi:hypothetical protein
MFNSLPPKPPPGKVATFYMKGGHVITVGNVEKVTMIRDDSTGTYSGYTIKWLDVDKAPLLFSLSVPDIVAVHVQET